MYVLLYGLVLICTFVTKKKKNQNRRKCHLENTENVYHSGVANDFYIDRNEHVYVCFL